VNEDVYKNMGKSKESEMRSIEGMLQADYVSGYVFGSFFDSLVYASENLPSHEAAPVTVRVDWQQFGKLYKRGNLGSVFEGTLARSNIRKGLYPGTMLMNMPSWKAFLRRLAGPIGADVSVADMFRQHMQAYGGGVSAGTAFWQQQLSNPKNRTAMYAHVQAGNVPVAHTDEPWWRTAVGGINKEAWFISMMEAARPLFHAFLHFFDIWLKSNPFEWLSEAATFGAADEVSISPRMRPFREYHVAIDAWDIISNDISCSTGAMWNSVLITNGTSQPEIIDVSDHLKAADKIVRVFNEPNADLDIFNMASETNTGPVNNRVLVGNTRIAQGVRKMYRGQIILRGNPRIKPSDILYIYDLKNMIWGPIEVERVTHTFNSNDGYTTTVKPKCYVEVNNYDGGLTSMVVNAFYDAAGLGLPLVAGLTTAAVGGFTPMGLAFGIGAWQSARKITDRSIAYLKRNKFSASVAGAPSWAGQRTPVRIFPLSRMGSPWVAGLAGMLDSKDFTSYLWGEFDKDISDAQDGATHAPSKLIPWLTLSPRCLLFDTREKHGNFFWPYMPREVAPETIGKRQFVWVLKTQALQHFEINTHFEWTDEGFTGGNFKRLLQQEYRYEIQTMLATRDKEAVGTEEVVYQELAKRLLQTKELIGRFPVALNNTVSEPQGRVHMVVLQCNKGKPVNDVTLAHIDTRKPAYNMTEITPGLSGMLGSLKGRK
jgi:hypothetical protein